MKPMVEPWAGGSSGPRSAFAAASLRWNAGVAMTTARLLRADRHRTFVKGDDWQLHFALANARALIVSHGVTASGRAMLSARRRSSSLR